MTDRRHHCLLRPPRREFSGFAGLVLICVLLPLGGCVTPVSPAPRVAPAGLSPAQVKRETLNLRVFDRVWDTVNRKYYDAKLHGVDWPEAAKNYGSTALAATDDVALYAAINGMLGLLADRHTAALLPVQAKDFRTQQRAMTGFRMLRVGSRWVVDEVLPGSPAEAAGVQRGWIVLSRDGQPLGAELALPVLQGGEVVRWEFLDARSRTVALALTACRVSTTRQEARSLPGGILLLRFDDFDWSKMHWFSHQLKAHRDAPGLIVDLRHNPGGTLISMDFMVGDLVDHDFTYACSINRAGHRWKLKALTLGSARFRGPVAVLVDQTSGSAAELFAAVLQEQHRARIIGRKTDGDVLLARFRELADGGMLEYSYFDLRTAGGRRLEGSGVTPDVILPPPTLEELQAGRDLDVEAAVRLLSQP